MTDYDAMWDFFDIAGPDAPSVTPDGPDTFGADLWAAVEADPHLYQIAQDSPEQIERYWDAYHDESRAVGFAEYVENLQVHLERPALGEISLAFERGAADEILLTDVGHPHQNGFDLVTYDPSDGHIRLFDDKSVADVVSDVSSMDRNLLLSIGRAINEITPLAGDPDIGTQATDAVDRLTQAYERISDAGSENWAQQVRETLAELHIDRIVTNCAGPAETAITGRLAESGFISLPTRPGLDD